MSVIKTWITSKPKLAAAGDLVAVAAAAASGSSVFVQILLLSTFVREIDSSAVVDRGPESDASQSTAADALVGLVQGAMPVLDVELGNATGVDAKNPAE